MPYALWYTGPVFAVFLDWRQCCGLFSRAPRFTLAVLVALATGGVGSAFAEPTDVELSARIPVGIGVGSATQFELGINTDLVWFPVQGDFGAGLSGQLTSLGFCDGRMQLGLVLAYMPDGGGRSRMGLGLNLGVAVDSRADYLYGRASYQIRDGIFGGAIDYACSSALYLELRHSIDDPAVFQGSVGIELVAACSL